MLGVSNVRSTNNDGRATIYAVNHQTLTWTRHRVRRTLDWAWHFVLGTALEGFKARAHKLVIICQHRTDARNGVASVSHNGALPLCIQHHFVVHLLHMHFSAVICLVVQTGRI